MDGKGLDSQQIFPAGNALGDGGGVGVLHVPAGLATAEGRAPVVDLEPVAATVVLGDGARRLRHVHRDRALVVHGRVEGEGERVTGVHIQRARVAAGGTADVASEIVGGQVYYHVSVHKHY